MPLLAEIMAQNVAAACTLAHFFGEVAKVRKPLPPAPPLGSPQSMRPTYLTRGAAVRVVRGQKVPIGTAGVVIWYGTKNPQWGPRVGLKDAAGVVHWTSAGNVEVI